MIIRKIFSLATSIISLFIIFLFSTVSSKSDENNFKYYSNDEGILSVMYHRFNEKKYPSTNIQLDIFKKHIEIIKNSNFNFHDPNNFDKQFNIPRIKKEIKKLGLKFLGFQHPNNTIISKFNDIYIDEKAYLNLDYWEEFENNYSDTFSTMYQFWVQKI